MSYTIVKLHSDPNSLPVQIYLGDKHALFGWFGHVYHGYTVGNGVFLATRQQSQENECFQQYNHDIHNFIYIHSNALH